MTNDEISDSPGTTLCKACGLCCTGHLFIWAKLRPSELDPAEALGMHVYRSDPTQRGFSQPCPLWQGQCTIYTTRHYPRSCRAYTCNLFDDVIAEKTTLAEALPVIEQAKAMIRELEFLLPFATNPNFRERLVGYLESQEETVGPEKMASELQQKAEALLHFYETVFGVKDLLEKPEKDGDSG